jgi:uncharacterized OB-fold protein
MSQGGNPTERRCATCGQVLHGTDHFCPHCGATVGAVAAEPTQVQPTPTTVPPPPPGGQPPPPAGPPPGTPPPTTPTGTDWRSAAPWIALGVVVLVTVIGIVVLLVSRSDDGGTADPDTVAATGDTVPAPALTGGAPVTVTLTDDPGATRVHPVTLAAGEQATVFVTSGQPFAPNLAVNGPDGRPLAADAVALADRGGAVSIEATASGDHELLVSAFAEGQTDYTAQLEPDTQFLTPEDVPLRSCVDRWGDERWSDPSGFLVVNCDLPHEGQVFEQVSGFGGGRQAADERCDEARGERIALPGPVRWWSYWGDDLTCVVVGDEGTMLDRSVVSG